MEQHYLERSEGTEHKFYELTLDGVSLTVRYGRIGTQGQTQQKTFPTPEAARKEVEKKLNEKRKGGYADAVPGGRAAKAVPRPLLKLPDILKPDRAAIEANLQPCIHLLRADTPARLWGSKVGGVPYRERGQPWPTTPDGAVLAFLAQLNFAELPALEGFPARGVLQFFILDDDLMGCDLGALELAGPDSQTSFRVLYHAEVREDETQLDLGVPDWEWDILPHDPVQEVPLRGVLGQSLMSPRDRLFDRVGLDLLDETETEDGELLGEVRDEAYRALFGSSSQVGGHPDFTQSDPRGSGDPHVLLFQMGSDDDLGVMWGDSGVGNFFIRSADLAALDFSRVAYNWDCH